MMARNLSRPGAVTFTKVDTEAQKEIAEAYHVTALPTFIIFRNGQTLERVQGADPRKLQDVLKKLATEVEHIQGNEAGGSSSSSSGGGPGGGGGAAWRGADLARGYTDISGEVELHRCELLNVGTDAGGVRVLLDSSKPSALAGGGGSGGEGKAKDWVESDTDEQLMLFLPFRSIIKLHTLQVSFSAFLSPFPYALLSSPLCIIFFLLPSPAPPFSSLYF